MTIYNLFSYKLLLLFSYDCHYLSNYQFDQIWIIMKNPVIKKWFLFLLLELLL